MTKSHNQCELRRFLNLALRVLRLVLLVFELVRRLIELIDLLKLYVDGSGTLAEELFYKR